MAIVIARSLSTSHVAARNNISQPKCQWDNFIFDSEMASLMADAMLMHGVMAGIFAFLVAVVFGARGARKRRGGGEDNGPESHSSSSSGSQGKRIKKFKSDGTPVYE
jgi:hypothetical protein